MKKIIYYLLLIVPFIDLITSVSERYIVSIISIGTLFKMLLLLGSYFYVFFMTNSKYKKYSVMYYMSIPIYILLYFIFKPGTTNYVAELNFLVKFMFYPIILVFLYNYNSDYKINFNEIIKLLKYNALFISFTILIAYLTGTGFNSYSATENSGAIGWYYAANEVGTILTMLFPFILKEIINNKVLNYIMIAVVAFTMLIIGTKTSYLGVLLPTVLMFIYILFKNRNLKNILAISIFLILILFMSPNSAMMKNLKIRSSSSAANLIFSSRNIYLSRIQDIYVKSDIDEKLFGIGFMNREEIDNPMIEKAVEMDFYDIFYRYGIIGLLIYFTPIGFLILFMMRYLIVHFKNYDLDIATSIYSVGISFIIALIAGHTFSAPAVSLYLAFAMILFVVKMQEKKINFY